MLELIQVIFGCFHVNKVIQSYIKRIPALFFLNFFLENGEHVSKEKAYYLQKAITEEIYCHGNGSL